MFFTCLWVHDLYILYKHNKICLILQKKKKTKTKNKICLILCHFKPKRIQIVYEDLRFGLIPSLPMDNESQKISHFFSYLVFLLSVLYISSVFRRLRVISSLKLGILFNGIFKFPFSI